MGVNAQGNFKVLVLFPEKAQSKFLYVISLNRTAMCQQVVDHRGIRCSQESQIKCNLPDVQLCGLIENYAKF